MPGSSCHSSPSLPPLLHPFPTLVKAESSLLTLDSLDTPSVASENCSPAPDHKRGHFITADPEKAQGYGQGPQEQDNREKILARGTP